MNLEQALSALREGKKIRHPSFAPNVYLQICRLGMMFDDSPIEDRPISIVKMNGDRQDDQMAGRLNYVGKIKRQLKEILFTEDYEKYHNIYTEIEISKIFDDEIFSHPQISLFTLISNDWEILP